MNKLLHINIFLLFFIIFLSCDSNRELLKIPPNNLQECYNRLDVLLDSNIKNEIMEMQSSDETIVYHHSIGRYIRNHWIHNGSPELIELLTTEYALLLNLNGYFADSFSSFILKNYWYYLHNQELNVTKLYEDMGLSYSSIKIPEINKDLIDILDEKIKEQISFFYNDLRYLIHVYKIKDSTDYYIYDIIRGWKRINMLSNTPEMEDGIISLLDEKIEERLSEYNNLSYMIHIYKIKNSSDYYVFDIFRGWRIISERYI